MSEIDEQSGAADLAPAAEPRRFTPAELLTCESCLRANAPTRTQCLYCGAELEPAGSALSPDPALQAPEGESNRIYIVARVRLGQSIADSVRDQLAERFHLKAAELEAALSTSAALPLTTVSREQAPRLLGELQDYGFETFSIQESDLQTTPADRKIRSLEFTDTTLNALTTTPIQQLRAAWSDLVLIVSGRLQTSRVEVEERQARDSVKRLDRRELTQDESVIDLYVKSGEVWRIGVNDFDFSCLGEQKHLTAFDNSRALLELLRHRSRADLNDAYTRIRPLLAGVWPLETTNSKSRSRRPRASRKDVATVTATDNTTQFNNYSRLVWRVKLLELRKQKS